MKMLAIPRRVPATLSKRQSVRSTPANPWRIPEVVGGKHAFVDLGRFPVFDEAASSARHHAGIDHPPRFSFAEKRIEGAGDAGSLCPIRNPVHSDAGEEAISNKQGTA